MFRPIVFRAFQIPHFQTVGSGGGIVAKEGYELLIPPGLLEAEQEVDITPIDDVRSTAAYRRSVSARILHRLLREEGGW